MKAGYEALFTVYGQPISLRSPLDSLGRYLIEANKPKVFADAIDFGGIDRRRQRAGSGSECGRICSIAAGGWRNDQDRDAVDQGESRGDSARSIRASVQMRVSGFGLVSANYDPKTQNVSYQVTQKIEGQELHRDRRAQNPAVRKSRRIGRFIVDEAAAKATALSVSGDIGITGRFARKSSDRVLGGRRRSLVRPICFRNSAISFRTSSRTSAVTARSAKTNINDAMRQVRLALLEADVDFQVAKNFIARVKEKALGEEVLRSVTPGQQIVKIFHDELTRAARRRCRAAQSGETGAHPDGRV